MAVCSVLSVKTLAGMVTSKHGAPLAVVFAAAYAVIWSVLYQSNGSGISPIFAGYARNITYGIFVLFSLMEE